MTLTGPVAARAVPFVLYILFLPLNGWLASAAPGFDARWLYALQCALVVVALLIYRTHYVELFEAPRLSALHWAVSVGVGLAVFALWIALDADWMTIGTSRGFDPRDADGRIDPVLAVLRVSGSALVVPVMEELFWRSFIARWIDRPEFLSVAPAALSMKALIVSSLLFGAEHHLWLAGIVAGLAYAGLYRQTGNLWSPIIAHAVTNGVLGGWILATGNWQFW